MYFWSGEKYVITGSAERRDAGPAERSYALPSANSVRNEGSGHKCRLTPPPSSSRLTPNPNAEPALGPGTPQICGSPGSEILGGAWRIKGRRSLSSWLVLATRHTRGQVGVSYVISSGLGIITKAVITRSSEQSPWWLINSSTPAVAVGRGAGG
jgi:hypothetical protein